ncbi:MAG: SGNH/GDSL hydrolase family protein [Armatimonadetes bacterium]|nr:SGNH/GDSL hydrolase family protein [Armatimonadota bacterium]
MTSALLVALSLGFVSPQASPKTYLSDVVQRMTKDWPNNRMVEIVCHGHSVPAGYAKTPEIRAADAYPNLLRLALFERFPHAVINVTVTAIGGENSISGEKRFAHDVLERHPDVVTIDYGLNDRGLDPVAVRNAWQSMVRQAKAQNIKVILMTPTADQSAKMDDPNDPLVQRALMIRELAKEEDVGLVDSFEAFRLAVAGGKPLVSLMAQVNHPNRQGHELVLARLLEWFPKPESGSAR